MRTDTLNAALDYADKGFSVIPIRPNQKIPAIKWDRHQNEAASKEIIHGWWRRFPEANVGIVTGKVSDLLIVDADSEEAFMAFKKALPKGFRTPMSKTPSGNYNCHFWFKYVDGIKNGVKCASVGNCDIRSEGGLIVVPPSTINGKAYEWTNFNLDNTKPQHLPTDIMQGMLTPVEPVRELPSNSTETIAEEGQWVFGDCIQAGSRDDALFHIGLRLRKGGASYQEMESFLAMIADSSVMEHNGDPIDPIDKARAAERHFNVSDRNISAELEEYFAPMEGDEHFDLRGVYTDLGIMDAKDKSAVRSFIHRKVKDEMFEKVGNKSGMYRKVGDESEEEIFDFTEDDYEEPSPFWMPFGITDYIEFYSGNVIVIAGEKSTGKTAVALNIVMNNMKNYKTKYFTNEFGKRELLHRIRPFDIEPKQWKWQPTFRCNNHKDYLLKGEGNLNVIDYIDTPEDSWRIGSIIKGIHDELDGAMAVICLQKDPNKAAARGGESAFDKARLFLMLETVSSEHGLHSMCTLAKTKNWIDPTVNPTGLQCFYKVIHGGKALFRSSVWERSIKELPVLDEGHDMEPK